MDVAIAAAVPVHPGVNVTTVPLMETVAFDGTAFVLEGIAVVLEGITVVEGIADVLGGGANRSEGPPGAATVFESVPPPSTEKGGETTTGPFWLRDIAYVPVELRVAGTVQSKVVYVDGGTNAEEERVSI